MPDTDAVGAALARVVDPCSIAAGHPISLPDMGMIKTIDIHDGSAEIVLRLTSPICWQAANIIARVEEVVRAVPGITDVHCSLDTGADWMPEMMAPAARAALRRLRPIAEPA